MLLLVTNDEEAARTSSISYIFFSFGLWRTDIMTQISGLVLLLPETIRWLVSLHYLHILG